ncbi:hypothetical protein FDUTEX481_06443 [Tolypothrix sp. PCC 7601]|nr:hypothetical protein FDUTEX481_06443 [Tolypothrix sp. PCC 7601]
MTVYFWHKLWIKRLSGCACCCHNCLNCWQKSSISQNKSCLIETQNPP